MGNQCHTQRAPYFSKKEELYYKSRLSEESKSSLTPLDTRIPTSYREIDAVIDRGNAPVKKVIDVSTGQTIAVKLLRVSSANPDSLKSIEHEAKILSELNHKNIVKFFGARVDNGYLKIYMEFVDGGSIRSLIDSAGPLAPEVAANFARQVCEGLEYLHAHRIMHRDIKCANILVDRHGTVKLTDFGCAKEVLSVTKSYFGTTGWMAPEVR